MKMMSRKMMMSRATRERLYSVLFIVATGIMACIVIYLLVNG
jgi:hypothetical protein